jgi:hypothetical protein
MTKTTQWSISAAVAVVMGFAAWGGLQALEGHGALDCEKTETITVPVKVGNSTIMQPREVCSE